MTKRPSMPYLTFNSKIRAGKILIPGRVLVWFRPTEQTDLEPIELFNVVSTITWLNFIGFRLVLRIRFGRFGWSKGSQSTTDGITPCNGRNHTRHEEFYQTKVRVTSNSLWHFLSGIDVIMEYAPSCARVVVVLSRDFLKHEWSHYQARLEIWIFPSLKSSINK